MTQRFSLILLLWIVLVSPQLAACGEKAYVLKDSGIPAIDAPLWWLDENRIVFSGYKDTKEGQPGQEHTGSAQKYPSFIWDIEHNKVSKFNMPEQSARLCFNGNYISYIRPASDEEDIWMLVSGKMGEEQESLFPKHYWFNRLSCRYYAEKPDWMGSRSTFPLLEEHGFLDLDFNTEPDVIGGHTKIVLHRPGGGSVPLPIWRKQIDTWNIRYAPFLNAYVLYGHEYVDKTTGQSHSSWPEGKPYQVWLLMPEGKVTEVAIPNQRGVGGPAGFYAIRGGIFMPTSDVTKFGEQGGTGGYVVKEEKVSRVVKGMLFNPAVSPDGCKVAFLNVPQGYGALKTGRIALQAVNVCEGE